MTLYKKSYAIQMHYDISDKEKALARQGLQTLDFFLKSLESFTKHLDLMFTPFKEHDDVTPEQIVKFRVPLRDFRDKAEDYLCGSQGGEGKSKEVGVKNIAIKLLSVLNQFSSDKSVEQEITAFNQDFNDLISLFEDFKDCYAQISSKGFKEQAVELIQKMKDKSADIENLVEGQIKNFFEKDILNVNWIDGVDGDKDLILEKKEPIHVDLHNKMMNSLTTSK